MSISAVPSQHVFVLVEEALAELGNRSSPLSAVVGKAKRIARLRNDFEALHWLELELRPVNSDFSKSDIANEISAHFSADEAEKRNKEVADAYLVERTIELPSDGDDFERKVMTFSVRELEDRLQMVESMRSELDPSVRQQMMAASTKTLTGIRGILARIEYRVHDFLSITERQLVYGQVNADIFERNREFVDSQLSDVSPRALEQISSAYQRAGEGDPEARSQALLSCRRALKSVADFLCPPSEDHAVDGEGSGHSLTEDKWQNRLVEFVKGKVGSSSTGDLLKTQLDDLARRFRGLSEASSRGVHVDASEFELNQAIIQTYLTIGDLLRLHADDSGLVVLAQGLSGSHAG